MSDPEWIGKLREWVIAGTEAEWRRANVVTLVTPDVRHTCTLSWYDGCFNQNAQKTDYTPDRAVDGALAGYAEIAARAIR